MKRKGFTLIELLAVIVIMGILMFAAISAVNRTIENARKDQFLNLAQNYNRAAVNLWMADQLECTTDGGTTWARASVVPTNVDGYHVFIATSSDSDYYGLATVQLLQQGGKSPWGNKDVEGYVLVSPPTNGQKIWSYPVLSDGVYSVNAGSFVNSEDLTRGDVTKGELGFEMGEEYAVTHYCRGI